MTIIKLLHKIFVKLILSSILICESIYIPISTAQKVMNRHNEINWFVCTVRKQYDTNVVEQKVRSILKKRHRIHPDDPKGVGSENVAEEFAEVMGLYRH